MEEQKLELSRQELHLLLFIRRLGYGELTVKVQDGVPVSVERACQKVRLGGDGLEEMTRIVVRKTV